MVLVQRAMPLGIPLRSPDLGREASLVIRRICDSADFSDLGTEEFSLVIGRWNIKTEAMKTIISSQSTSNSDT